MSTGTLPPRRWELVHGSAPHALADVPDRSVHAAFGSPPYYGKRDYNPADPFWAQLGQEDQPEQYVEHLVDCLDPFRRILRGPLVINIGDTYAGSGGPGGDYLEGGLRAGQPRWEGTAAKARRGTAKPDPRLGHDRIEGGVTGRRGHGAGGLDHHKPKDLIGIPFLFAQAMKAAGWWWRSDIIWAKPNPMPEGPGDRPAGAHEYVLLFSPTPDYYFDHFAIQEPAVPKVIKRKGLPALKLLHPKRLRRSVWTIPVSGGYRSPTITGPDGKAAHYATFPEALAARVLEATTPEIGVCSVCLAEPQRRTHRDPETKQLIHDGWTLPNCGHPWEPVGATFCDPFNGVATSGIAALRRGRSYLGVEPVALNIELSVERIGRELPAFAHRGTVTVPEPPSAEALA